jgi:uncharacterized protein YbaP (TraB family)
MVDIGPEARHARLAAMMERAEKVFERSRRLVGEARKARSEAEAKCRQNLAQNRTDNGGSISSHIAENAGQAAE